MSGYPEVRLLAATGMLGTGFPESSLRAGLEMGADMIGCDSGTTDGGPADLGTGHNHYSAHSYKRDLGLMLAAARSKRIPLIIGSAGGAGADANLNWARSILEEVARELRLDFRLGVIYASQDKTYLKQKLAEGKIRPLGNAPAFTDDVIDRSTNIVGMMGCEPMIRALEEGADVVLAGRASDTAIYSAVPLMRGLPAGAAWHAGKLLECGAAAVEQRTAPDCMFAHVRADGLIVRAPNAALRCTPVSVAAHSLYENGDPFRMVEPSGVLDLTDCNYEQLDERSVRVTGSRFIPADVYTVRLEGVEFVGYQTLTIAGVRDPVVIERLEDFLATAKERIARRVEYNYPSLAEDAWRVSFRVYGKNGTMGRWEPVTDARPHEVGLILESTAPTQEIANGIAAIARHQTLHNPVPQWSGMISNLAFPYGATDLARGPVYRFNMNCAVEPADPYEMFRFEFTTIHSAAVVAAPATV